MNVPETVVKFEDKEFRDFFSKLRSNLSDVSGLLKAVYGIFGVKDIQDHFKKERGPDGAWKKRSPKTQKWYQSISDGKELPPVGGAGKASYNPANNLLQMTGQTRQSIMQSNSRTLNAQSILVYAGTKYSGVQDRGGESVIKRRFKSGREKHIRVNIPERKFMWLSNDTKKGMAEALGNLLLP